LEFFSKFEQEFIPTKGTEIALKLGLYHSWLD